MDFCSRQSTALRIALETGYFWERKEEGKKETLVSEWERKLAQTEINTEHEDSVHTKKNVLAWNSKLAQNPLPVMSISEDNQFNCVCAANNYDSKQM